MWCYWNLLAFLLLNINSIKAQPAKFISSGKIEFERKIKLSALYETNDPTLDILKKSGQQFKKTFFTLTFDKLKTVYKPGKENPENYKFQKMPAEDNVVYTELDKKIMVSQKQVFDNVFLISDSVRKIQWKITDEKRQIAGFECKRANAIIMDSIYIVAYFTEEILTEGGPESFNGLPGMILGVAIPYEHITWFANNLSITEQNYLIGPPQKGKTISTSELKENVKQNFDVSNKIGNWYYKFSLL
jgi:GLPGLI family protein